MLEYVVIVIFIIKLLEKLYDILFFWVNYINIFFYEDICCIYKFVFNLMYRYKY